MASAYRAYRCAPALSLTPRTGRPDPPRASNLLLRRPLATQCVTSAVLFGAGDAIAQQAVEKKGAHHDVRGPPRIPVLPFLLSF